MRPGSASSRRCPPSRVSRRCPSSRRWPRSEGGAWRHHGHGLRHRNRPRRDRLAAAGARDLRHLCRHLLPVDADDAAHRCLCVARRATLRPQLGAAAAVGIGGVCGRCAGLRIAGRFHCRKTPDLGHRGGRRQRRADQPRPAAAGSTGARHGNARRQPAAARQRLSRHHRNLGADSGEPRRLLHLRFHRLAASGPRRAHHRLPVGAGRDRRDRRVCVLAAVQRCRPRCWW